MGRYSQSLRIVLDCVLLACCLGVAMDMVTAHVAVEYFTVHHPKVVDSTSPVVMALIWGIGASWWFGAIAGGILAFINSRRKEPLPVAAVRGMMARACLVLWVILMLILAGTYGLIGIIVPLEARRKTFDFDHRIMSVALTHMTEYVLGAIALTVVARKIAKT